MRALLRITAMAVLFSACSTQNDVTTPPDDDSEIGESAEQNVGASGGQLVTSSGSAKVAVPAGALPGDTTLSVTVQSPNEVAAPDAAQQPNAAVASNVYDFGPTGTQFTQPVAITVQSTAAAAAGQKNVVAYLDSNNVWQVLLDSQDQNGVVTASTTHFTHFAVLSVPTSGSGCGSQKDPNAYCAPHSCDPNQNTCTGTPSSDSNTLSVTPSSHTTVFTANPNALTADPNGSATLTVFVADALGHPMASQQVALAVSGSENSVEPASGASNANGVFVAHLSSTHAEIKTITATIGAFQKTATVAFVAGPPSGENSSITANPQSAPADGNSLVQVTVSVRDHFSNPVVGQSVALASNANGVHFSAATGVTDGKGNFVAAVSSTAGGVATITAASGSFTLTTQVQFNASAPTLVPDNKATTFTAAPTTLAADGTASATVTLVVHDANGNVVPNQAVSFTATGSTNVFSAGNGTTDSTGTFQSTLRSITTETKTIAANVGAFQKTTTVTFVAGPPSLDASSITVNPNAAPADGNSALQVTVVVRDHYNNPIAGQNVAFSSDSNAVHFSSTSGTTDAKGNIVVTASSSTSGTPSIVASVGSLALTTQASFTQASPPASGSPDSGSTTFTASPTTVAADGSALTTLTVTVRDATGNAVAGQAMTFTATGVANAFGASAGTSDANGTFVTTLRSTTAEAKSVTASIGSIHKTITVTFVSGPPDAKASTLTAAPSSIVNDGNTLSQITFTVRDGSGNSVANQTVSFSATGTNNHIAPVQGTTNNAGVFTTTLSSTTAEAKTVTATAGSVTLSTQVTVTPPR